MPMFKMKLIRSPIISVDVNVAWNLYPKEYFIPFFLFGIYNSSYTVFKPVTDTCVIFHEYKDTVKIRSN